MVQRLAAAIGGVLMTAAGAVAQAVYEAPPVEQFKEDKSTAMEWGIAAVFIVGCLAVAFKPTKRSNLR